MNGYSYGYYPYAGAQYPPRTVLPAMYYHPGLNNTNIDVTVDINDNLWWQRPGGGGGGGSWPNPTVPRPYPHPRPRPDPPPPPPCPGYGCAGAAAAYHCHGTCGGCGHVGCGGEFLPSASFPLPASSISDNKPNMTSTTPLHM